MQALGRHILVECHECDREILNDVQRVEDAMKQAALEAGATIVTSAFHHFNPHGVSGVVVIAESHLAIHTWPEYGYAAVDLFTCGDECDPWAGFEHLRNSLGAERVMETELRRGKLDLNGRPLLHKPLEVSGKPSFEAAPVAS